MFLSDLIRELTALVVALAFGFSSQAETPTHHPMPEGWILPPVTNHPCLLFGPEDAAAIKTRLARSGEAGQTIEDKALRAYFADDKSAQRDLTKEFIAYWKSYSQRWTQDKLDQERPDGVAMRGIWRSIYLYDVVESFGFLTDPQRAEFRDALAQRIHWAIGPDKEHRRHHDDNWRHHNIYSDVLVSAGTTALAFPELPEARDWIEFATDELEWQLENSVWDGAWHEAPRYQAHILKTTGLFYRSLKRRTGVNMFQQPDFKAMLDWLVRFGTPLDKVAGAHVGKPDGVMLVPGIGDSGWTQPPYSLCAMFAPEYLKTDPAFAARLMWAWQRGGAPYEEWARVLIDPALPARPQILGSDVSPGKGYVLMRSGFDTPDEIWFLLRCGRRTLTGHDHADANAFNLYAFGCPLCLDSGSGEYSDPMHKAWNDRAVAHNTIVFGDRSQKRADGKILAFVSKPEADYSVTDASVPAGVKQFVRTVVFVKPDYFVIWDQIQANEPARWMIHTTAANFEWSEHKVRCITPWQANLDVHVVLPETPLKSGVEEGPFEKGKASDESPFPFLTQHYFGISNAPGGNFLTVLNPLKPGQTSLTIKYSGTPGRPVLEIRCGLQQDRLELAAGGGRLTREGPINASVSFENEKTSLHTLH